MNYPTDPIVFKVVPPPPSRLEFFQHNRNIPSAAGRAWINQLRCITDVHPVLPIRYPCAIHVDLHIPQAYVLDYVPVILCAIKESYMVGLDKNVVDFSIALTRLPSTKDSKVVFSIRPRPGFVHEEEK